jgi:hypothetical protein
MSIAVSGWLKGIKEGKIEVRPKVERWGRNGISRFCGRQMQILFQRELATDVDIEPLCREVVSAFTTEEKPD